MIAWLAVAALAAAPGEAFPAVAVADATGATVRLDAGPVRVVNLWATWCGPCRREMPRLDAAGLPAGAEVVFVSVDASRPKAVALASHLRLSSRLLYDGEPLAAAIAPGTLPYTLVVDGTGVVRATYEGDVDDAELAEIRALVATLVAPTLAPAFEGPVPAAVVP